MPLMPFLLLDDLPTLIEFSVGRLT